MSHSELKAKLIMVEGMTEKCKEAIDVRDSTAKGSKEREEASRIIDIMLEMTQTIINFKPSK